MADREISLDGDELEQIKNSDETMTVQRYVNGELTELEIKART